MATAYNSNFAGGNSGTLIALGTTGAVTLNALQSPVYSLTPTGAITMTANTVAPAKEAVIFITTAGTTAYVITFGTGFKSQGTLSTGTTNGATFAIYFKSNGTNLVEVSRTVAM